MGARANYAIIEKGTLHLYYSHWGAETAGEDVYWGPAATEAFLRQNEPTTEWLDSVFAEGGIVLDKDTRRLTWFTWYWPGEPDLERAYQTILERVWGAEGWSVKRAVDWGDIAEAAGVPRQAVEAAPVAPHRIPLEDLGSNLDKGICGAILSVKDAASWSDYAIDFQLCGLLMHGPNLLTGLARLPTLNALRSAFAQRADSDTAKVPGDWIHSYCRIDIQERSLRLAVPDDEASALHFVEAAWPGWAVSRAEGGPAPHFAETGREAPPDLVQPPDAPEPEPPNRPMEECLRMIEEHMAGAETRKAAHLGWRTQLQNRLDAEKGPMIWAPRFLRPVPGSRPGWFRRLLHRWRNR